MCTVHDSRKGGDRICVGQCQAGQEDVSPQDQSDGLRLEVVLLKAGFILPSCEPTGLIKDLRDSLFGLKTVCCEIIPSLNFSLSTSERAAVGLPHRPFYQANH